MPDDHARAADDTRKLRARFPGWGILFDPLERVWVAVRGKRTLVAASSPEKLTEQVEAAARGEAGPDEGDKTKTWRALRKHGRGLAAAAGRNGAAPGGFLANGDDASAALTLQYPSRRYDRPSDWPTPVRGDHLPDDPRVRASSPRRVLTRLRSGQMRSGRWSAPSSQPRYSAPRQLGRRLPIRRRRTRGK